LSVTSKNINNYQSHSSFLVVGLAAEAALGDFTRGDTTGAANGASAADGISRSANKSSQPEAALFVEAAGDGDLAVGDNGVGVTVDGPLETATEVVADDDAVAAVGDDDGASSEKNASVLISLFEVELSAHPHSGDDAVATILTAFFDFEDDDDDEDDDERLEPDRLLLERDERSLLRSFLRSLLRSVDRSLLSLLVPLLLPLLPFDDFDDVGAVDADVATGVAFLSCFTSVNAADSKPAKKSAYHNTIAP
jgi:hypothetical protein